MSGDGCESLRRFRVLTMGQAPTFSDGSRDNFFTMVSLPHVAARESAAARSLAHSWTPHGDASRDLPADVGRLPVVMVNVYFVGDARGWVLIDAGLPFAGRRILRAARERFGDVPPRAIVLTHGHADHVGSLATLLKAWPNVTVYAHEMELPYLTGRSSYPPADPTVGGGLMARTSPLLAKGPYDFGGRIAPLPDDGGVPGLAEWRWVATPGHSPGHVSFFRDRDGTLIAGDAFVTQRQESLVGIVTQHKVLRGPPAYFTADWQAAWRSVERLAALRPRIALCGHGRPLVDPPLSDDLARLARSFATDAIPSSGRYVDRPAVTNARGIVSLPPRPFDWFTAMSLTMLGIFAIGAVAFSLDRRPTRT